MVAPWPHCDRDTPRFPGALSRQEARKNRRPGQGTSGVMPVVPPHFVAAMTTTLARTAHEARCGGSLTGADLPSRAPAAAYYGTLVMPIRSGALRSFSPAFLVPLCSDRGSLARFRRVHVLVSASIFSSLRTLSGVEPPVNPLAWAQPARPAASIRMCASSYCAKPSLSRSRVSARKSRPRVAEARVTRASITGVSTPIRSPRSAHDASP
jgi:hypothetical protein